MVLNICKYVIGLCTVEWGISQNSFEYALGERRAKCCLKHMETIFIGNVIVQK